MKENRSSMVAYPQQRKWRGLIVLGVLFCVALPTVQFLENHRGGQADHLTGWTEDWGQAQKEAEEKGKPRLVLFTADWCQPCQILKRDVLTQPEVAKYLAERFIRVKVDLTEPDARQRELGEKYEAEFIPTMVIIDGNGEVRGKASGVMEKSEFMEWAGRFEK
jgi:thiol:disulfide interchange protein